MGAARTTVCGRKRGNGGSADDSGRAKGARSRPVVVAACRQVQLIAKKVADVNGRTDGLTEAAHAARASWFLVGNTKIQKFKFFPALLISKNFVFQKNVFFILPPGPLDAQQMPLSSK